MKQETAKYSASASNLLAMEPPRTTSCTSLYTRYTRYPSLRVFLPKQLFSSFLKPICIALSLFLLCAFNTQPLDERKAQDALPMSKTPLWDTLQKTKVKVDKKQGYYSAKIPPAVKNMAGKELTISGFMMPLESKDKFKHFLLSKRTPTCPFCPPGEPNEIIDVWTVKPVEYTDDMITVKGKFELINDKEMGLFFKLKDASREKS